VLVVLFNSLMLSHTLVVILTLLSLGSVDVNYDGA
jgi:hypothetical protein